MCFFKSDYYQSFCKVNKVYAIRHIDVGELKPYNDHHYSWTELPPGNQQLQLQIKRNTTVIFHTFFFFCQFNNFVFLILVHRVVRGGTAEFPITWLPIHSNQSFDQLSSWICSRYESNNKIKFMCLTNTFFLKLP